MNERFEYRADYFAKNSLYLIVSTLVTLFAGFFLPFFFTHLSTKEIYGQFAYAVSIIGIINLVTLPGINVAIIQGVAQGREGIFWVGTKVRMLWALAGSAICLIIGYKFYISFRYELANLFFILPIILPLIYGLDTATPFFNGKRNFKLLSFVAICLNLIPLIVAIIFIWLIGRLIWISFGYYLTVAILNVTFFIFIKNRFKPNRQFDPKNLSFGKHISIVNAIGNIQYYFDKVLIGALFGFSNLAVFSIGKLFKTLSYAPCTILYQLLLPRLSRQKRTEALHSINNMMIWILILFGAVFFLLILLLPKLIPIFFTIKYAESINYARLFIISVLASVPGLLYETYFKSQGLMKEIYILRIALGFVDIGLMAFLTLIYGIIGVIYAQILSRLVYSVLGWRLARSRI